MLGLKSNHVNKRGPRDLIGLDIGLLLYLVPVVGDACVIVPLRSRLQMLRCALIAMCLPDGPVVAPALKMDGRYIGRGK